MTKELLEQYPDLCAEIKELEEQIRRGVSDTVSGSSPDYPYTQHPITIQGVPPDLHERIDFLKGQAIMIEEFINALPNSTYRRIVRYRVKYRMSWKTIAAKMGYRYSEQMVKRKYYEIFSKNRTF